jgi:uridylate kinase
VLLKGTKVDGVFDSDPLMNPAAKRYDRLTYQQVLAEGLGVMDLTAVAMCMESRIPIVVFQLSKKGTLARIARGEDAGTLISV